MSRGSNIKIRYQSVKDAKRFYEILSNPNFRYFSSQPKSLAAEKEFLKKNSIKRRQKIDWNYSIIYNQEVTGAVGIRKNVVRPHIAEIGYFIDEKFWGKGLASQAVKLIEKIAVGKFKFKRLEIVVQVKNIASSKVAEKNGYRREGLCRKMIMDKKGKLQDAYLYAKVL